MGLLESLEKAFFNLAIILGISIALIVVGSYSASAADSIKKSWRDDPNLDKAHNDFNTGAWVGLGLGIGLAVFLALVVIGLIFELEVFIDPVISSNIFIGGVGVLTVALAFYAGISMASGKSQIKKSNTYKNTTDQKQKDTLDKAIDDGNTAAWAYLLTSITAIIIVLAMAGRSAYGWYKREHKKKELKHKKDESINEKKEEIEEKKEDAKKHKEELKELKEEQFQSPLAVEKAKKAAIDAKTKQLTQSTNDSVVTTATNTANSLSKSAETASKALSKGVDLADKAYTAYTGSV